MAVEIKVGGTWLSTIPRTHWGAAVITHRWPLGNWLVEWEMDVPHNFQHPALRVGRNDAPTVVEVYQGTRIWIGTLSEPNWDDNTFSANGLCRSLENAVALDPTNKRVTNPGAALFFSNARGATNVGALTAPTPDLTTSGETDRLNTVAALWDAYGEQINQKWEVDRNGVLWINPDPTTPKWWVTPGAAVLGVADEEYATHWYCTFLNATNGRYEHVSASDESQQVGRSERMADLTPRGAITLTEAQQIANNILAKTKARTGWTNGATVSGGQITNVGGINADLSLVRAGHMMRLQGLEDQRGPMSSTDVVIGESIWNVDEGEITLNPVEMVDRDFAHIVESFGGELAS